MLIVASLCLLTGCKPKVKYKYELVSMTGIPGVTADQYEYNYIYLYSDGTCKFDNKFSGIVTTTQGKYKIDEKNEKIIYTLKSGSTEVKEEHVYKDNQIIMEQELNSYKIKLVYELVK